MANAGTAKVFKVIDKPDGSTVIYCSKTDQFLVVLGKRNSNNRVSAQAMGHPAVPPTAIRNSNQNAVAPASPGIKKPSACVLPLPRLAPLPSQKVVKKEAFPPLKPEFKDVDYSDDCITGEQFFQVLNLVPKNKLASAGPSNTQKKEFPLRHISKRSEEVKFTAPSLAKVYDEVDLSSPLGKKWLYEGRNIITPAAAVENCKKYSFYCRVSLSNTKSKDYDVPKLRCRIAKAYPETFRPQKNHKGGCHMYSFTKRQRLERLKVIKTGLNSKSRKLKRQIKPCSVKIERLSPKFISDYIHKKKKPSVIDVTTQQQTLPDVLVVDSSAPIEPLPSPSSSVVAHDNDIVILEPEPVEVQPRKRLLKVRKCSVKLRDVTKRIINVSGTYYVKGTSIRVKGYGVMLNNYSLPCGSSNPIFKVPVNKIVIQMPNHDHPYHRVRPLVLCAQSIPLSISKTSSAVSCWQRVSAPPTTPKVTTNYPVIDLVDDDNEEDEEIKVMVPHQVIQPSPFSLFVFNCFGCHFRKTFTDRAEADSTIQQHMKGYHSVLQPDMFTQCNPDYSRRMLFIEAFPGYKTSKSPQV